GLSDQNITKRELHGYQNKIDASRDSLMTLTPENSIWHLIYLSNEIREDGDYDRALKVLFKAYNQLTTEDRDMAHVAFYISDLYRLKEDVEQEKRYLIVSSITDLKYAVKEYVSLWKLASLLYEEGD